MAIDERSQYMLNGLLNKQFQELQKEGVNIDLDALYNGTISDVKRDTLASIAGSDYAINDRFKGVTLRLLNAFADKLQQKYGKPVNYLRDKEAVKRDATYYSNEYKRAVGDKFKVFTPFNVPENNNILRHWVDANMATPAVIARGEVDSLVGDDVSARYTARDAQQILANASLAMPLAHSYVVYGDALSELKYVGRNAVASDKVVENGGVALSLNALTTSDYVNAHRDEFGYQPDSFKNTRQARFADMLNIQKTLSKGEREEERDADDVKVGYDQLSDAFLDFVPEADLKKLQKVISPDHHFNEDNIKRGQMILQHLYDNGLDFELTASDKFENQLNAAIKTSDGSNLRVRVLDDDPRYIGHISNASGHAYYLKYNTRGKKDNFEPEDPLASLDFFLGLRKGRIVRSADKSRQSSYVMLDGVSRSLYFAPHSRMSTLTTIDPKDATKYLQDMVEQARHDFEVQYMKDHDLTEDTLEPDKAKEMHAATDETIGSFDDGFDVEAAIDAGSKTSVWSTEPKVINALKLAHYDVDKLKGTDFMLNKVKDNMLTFDKTTMKTMDDPDLNDFQKKVLDRVVDKLQSSGVHGKKRTLSDGTTTSAPVAAIDAQGIVRWAGYRPIRRQNAVKVGGELGQFFSPDEHGIIQTKFGSKDDFGLIPGIKGYYVHGSGPRMDRARGIGYEQLVMRKIDQGLTDQLLRRVNADGHTITNALDVTMCNKLYHGDLYGFKVKPDWYENSPLSDDLKQRIIDDQQRRVRFSNKLGENAATFSQNSYGRGDDARNSQSELVDGKNIRVLDNDYLGYFDMDATATNKQQGLVLYAVKGGGLNPDGTFKQVVPTKDNPEPHMALKDAPEFKYLKNSAWDRRQMAINQAMTAERIDYGARAALMTMGMWTYEDSAVISKKFAERNQVPGADGKMRPLRLGDKLSDFGANKATIGLIVDPDMDPREARRMRLDKEVAIFKKNDLDVVMSPYSVVTRFNTGVVKELRDSKDIRSVVDPTTNKQIGESGNLNMIVTNMLVDRKSHAYDEEAVRDGKGRKLSSQLVWSLTEHGAAGVLKEGFNHNANAWADYREYLIATGYDMGPDSTLKVGYDAHPNEKREVFDVNDHQSADDFMDTLGDKGGFLKLPFKVKLSSDVETDKLPVLSSSLRRSTELISGGVKTHDYTIDYTSIYEVANQYKPDADDDMAKKTNQDSKENVQRIVNELQNKIIYDKLGGPAGETSKHGHIRDNMMSVRQSHSATAVLTADPRLPLDVVGVSPQINKVLNTKRNDYVSVHRDPALRSGAIRGMKPVLKPDAYGVSLNPIVEASFDADNDGDTLGIMGFSSPEAQHDLKGCMAVKNNLKDPSTENGDPYINTGMDMVSGAIEAGLVKYEPTDPNAESPKSQVERYLSDVVHNQKPDDAIKSLNTFVATVRKHDYGAARIDISSDEKMYDSLTRMVDTGAKGKPMAIENFKKYFDGNATRADAQEIQFASGVKSDLTGVAGANSQKLFALVRNQAPGAALETTYGATQGTLQIKHDAPKARSIDKGLNNDLRLLLNGRSAENEDQKSISKKQWKREMKHVYDDVLGVPLNTKNLDTLADLMSDGTNEIKPVKDLMETYAAPMDQIAYGGGMSAVDRLAKEHRKLSEGKWTEKIVPETILHPSVDAKLVKKDTQAEIKDPLGIVVPEGVFDKNEKVDYTETPQVKSMISKALGDQPQKAEPQADEKAPAAQDQQQSESLIATLNKDHADDVPEADQDDKTVEDEGPAL